MKMLCFCVIERPNDEMSPRQAALPVDTVASNMAGDAPDAISGRSCVTRLAVCWSEEWEK
jgi:hypothetical protein